METKKPRQPEDFEINYNIPSDISASDIELSFEELLLKSDLASEAVINSSNSN